MPNLPKYEDWKAPWELKGEDFDEEAARKYIYTLSSDKEKLQGRITAASTEKTTLQEQLDAKVKELEAAQAKGDNAEVVTNLQNEKRDLSEKLEKSLLENLQLKVADDKGLPLSQAKRLSGKTKEELEADADEFLKEFGAAKADPNNDDEDEDEVGPRISPRLTTPGDHTRTEDAPVDIDKIIDSIPRS